jgi:type II secretory pathway component PulF
VITFTFKARDRAGKLVSGELDGEDQYVVRDLIAKDGLFPVSISPKPKEMSLGALFEKKPTSKDISSLTRQFEVMFAAGTPIDRILVTLAKQVHNKPLAAALKQIQRDVAMGMRVSAAFKKHPKIFNTLYTSMLEVGETGGMLNIALKEMASIMEKEDRIKSKVKSAMLYPKIVMGVLGLVMWAMLVFVIPPFQQFYAKYNAELPLPTTVMLALSKLATTYWYIPVVVIGSLIYAWKKFKTTPRGQRFTSTIGFKAPVFGRLNLLVANARFGHLTAALYRAGVPLTTALNVIAATMPNIFFAKDIISLKTGIEHGSSLSKAMEQTVYFEPMVKEACAVGEKIGRIDDLLESTAKFYDEEVDDTLKNLSTLIEPIMLVFLFGAVLFLALAIYLPIWNISRVVLNPHG